MSEFEHSTKLLLTPETDPLSGWLDELASIEPMAAHRWQWKFDDLVAEEDLVAEVSVDPGDALRIELEASEPLTVLAGLSANNDLPGNLRYAADRQKLVLVADTLRDGEAHLPRTFEAARSGLRRAMSEDTPREVDPLDKHKPLRVADVGAAIEAGGWDQDSVVDLDGSWELRPRLRGDATPVRAEIVGAELRLCRPVLPDVGRGVCRDAICAQALRYNFTLRHARLVLADQQLFADARLHGDQLTRFWLETAARAVAVACRHTEVMLGVLAKSEAVAGLYAATLLIEEE